MACRIGIKITPDWRPQDILLPIVCEFKTDRYSIITSPNQTTVSFIQNYQQTQIRTKGNMETYYGDKISLDCNTDIIIIYYEDTTIEIRHLNPKTYDSLAHNPDYLD